MKELGEKAGGMSRSELEEELRRTCHALDISNQVLNALRCLAERPADKFY